MESVTPALEALLGYSAQEMCGRPVDAFLVAPQEGGSPLHGGDGSRARTKSGRLIDVTLRISDMVAGGAGEAEEAAKLVAFSSAAPRDTDADGEDDGDTDGEGEANAAGGGPRGRTELLHTIMSRLGYSLDIEHTCDVLVGTLVPGFADWAVVDLVVAVFTGDPLPSMDLTWPTRLRMAALRSVPGMHVDLQARAGAVYSSPETSRTRRLRIGKAILTTDIKPLFDEATRQGEFLRTVYPREANSVIIAPLFTHDGVLGALSMTRRAQNEPFDEEDLQLVQDILPKASLNLSNAWQYAREYRMAVGLQKSLLPRDFTTTTAANIGGAYVAAGAARGVSGDWYDVIPLSSFRTAFVVGDVVGRGLEATAMMGRLRTAVQSFADMDLDPEEVLSHLDDLVLRVSEEQESDGAGDGDGVTGSTCLYAIYDPASHRCVMASAGHPAPAVVAPDGSVGFVDVDPGPPLGVGGLPFEMTDIELAPGSVLAFYTDGLVGDMQGPDGTRALERELGRSLSGGESDLGRVSRDVVSTMLPVYQPDDAALLLVRTRELSGNDIAHWDVAAEESEVAGARSLVSDQLTRWGMEDFVFTGEIVASELVTNAIRYAEGPVEMRLLRDGGVLVCEVTDQSNTQPRMRRARTTDEHGRGLFIIAQLARRWGSRYGQTGKTVWAEIAEPSV